MNPMLKLRGDVVVRSQKAYIAQAAFEYFVAILVSDVFLAKLLTYMGFSDSLIGIISSLISFSFLFQLFTIAMIPRIKNIKRTVVIFDTVSQLFFAGIYVVPFLRCGIHIKAAIVIGCLLAAYFLKYLISTVFFKWANSFVEPEKRGAYSAKKEMVSLASGIVFTLLVGYAIDSFERNGMIVIGFATIAVTITALNVCNLASLLLISGEKRERNTENQIYFKEIWKNTIRNRSFMNVVLMSSLWSVAYYMTIGFMGTFKTSELMLSLGTVQGINIGANLCKLAISRPFGRYSDKTSYAKGFRMSLVILAASYLFNMFATPASRWCVVVFSVLQAVSQAGSNQNKLNICYNYVQSDYLVYAMTIQNSVSGLAGFAASLIGSGILAAVQRNNNQICGITVYGQQVLSAISLGIVLITIAFTREVVEKQERVIQ